MGISKYTLYKYVKVDGTWRYRKAAFHENAKIKPDVVFVDAKQGLLEKHPEGRYYMSHNGGWIDAGTDALEAQRKRKQRLALDEFNRLSGKGAVQGSVLLLDGSGRITLAATAEKYFANCEARGLDPETIRKYRAAVDPFVERCGVTYVDECRDNKQVLLNYMGWLRKQPAPKRRHSNPDCSAFIIASRPIRKNCSCVAGFSARGFPETTILSDTPLQGATSHKRFESAPSRLARTSPAPIADCEHLRPNRRLSWAENVLFVLAAHIARALILSDVFLFTEHRGSVPAGRPS